MAAYIARRLAYMILTLAVTSVLAFVIIQLPPGDFLNSEIERLRTSGGIVNEATIAALRTQYGLDLPPTAQYLQWVRGMLRGRFGMSFIWVKPVGELIGERLGLTVVLAVVSLLFTYVVAIPIGIYSATHQYSAGDYLFSVVGFIGLAVPSFLLAIVLMYLFYTAFGISVGGLFSRQYLEAPWSLGKIVDMVNHLWIPVIVIGLSGTASLVRMLRGSLLDELKKQYVVTARAKGVDETRLLFKYPVRLAMNPLISSLPWIFPRIISGSTIVAVVLNLPTTGPMLLEALMNQDMYLAGTLIMFLTFLAIVGTFVADLLLVAVDPRIRVEQRAAA